MPAGSRGPDVLVPGCTRPDAHQPEILCLQWLQRGVHAARRVFDCGSSGDAHLANWLTLDR